MEANVASDKSATKVIVASALGTIVDYYDLFIVTTAASLVWPTIFFTGLSAAAKVSLSVITFGITYVSRPLGAIIFGHFGDRIGRRNMMVWTLILTVIGVGGIAALPPSSVVGVAIGVGAIVLFRIIQGIGLGGEWPAASSLSIEYVSRSKRRAFLTGWIQNGANIGLLFASLVFTFVSTVFTKAELLAYAWRIPFIIGVVILGIAIFIRLKIEESPLFRELKKENKVERLPLIDSIKDKWKTMLLLLPTTFFVIGAPGIFVSGPYVLDVVTASHAATDAQLSLAVSAASGLAILWALLGSFLGDKFGRRGLMILSSVLVIIFLYPFELLVKTDSYALFVVGLVLLNGFFKIADGVTPALISEQFETRYRFSGAGFAYQLGSLALGIISITLIPFIVSYSGGVTNSFGPIVIVGIISAILTVITVAVIPETVNKPVK
ncbi:MFS transporter [Thermoplasmatales archaeon AK]|nr:MFS transporter [Thermoplasmatales archaeon AK]